MCQINFYGTHTHTQTKEEKNERKAETKMKEKWQEMVILKKQKKKTEKF